MAKIHLVLQLRLVQEDDMRIKKHINGNHYIVTPDGLWVRDFSNTDMPFTDINKLYARNELTYILENEVENASKKYVGVDTQENVAKKAIIISDGYDFNNKHKLLSKIPNDVSVIAVNGALSKWELVGEKCPKSERRAINYYIVNNPFKECTYFLPKKHSYYPNCIASYRTHPNFLKNYKGYINVYSPSGNEQFISNTFARNYKIDDYRNPICAAIGLAFRFGVKQLMLLCCDEAFKDVKDGAEKLDSGLYQYPQHRICTNLIDANLHWLKKQEVEIANHSFINYSNATYINEDKVLSWFNHA
jgi:hypothetical protein